MHGVHVLFWNVTVLLQPQERPDPAKQVVMHVLVLTSALLHTARHALAKVAGVPKMRQPSWGKPRTTHAKERVHMQPSAHDRARVAGNEKPALATEAPQCHRREPRATLA